MICLDVVVEALAEVDEEVSVEGLPLALEGNVYVLTVVIEKFTD
jgi:hypothetical protein